MAGLSAQSIDPATPGDGDADHRAGDQRPGRRQRLERLIGNLGLLLDPTKRRALTALGIRVVGAAIAYAMQVLLARWMGLGEYGIFVGIWVWLIVFGGIAPLGLNVGIIGPLATFRDEGDLARWRGLVLTSVAVTCGAGLTLALGGWLAIAAAPGLFAKAYLMPLWLSLFCIPLMALSEINEGISRANGWMTTALAPTYLLRPCLLIGGASIALATGAELNATLIMALAIFACLATIAAQGGVLVWRVRKLGAFADARISATPVAWVWASLPIVLAQTFELTTQNFDIIAVSYFLGPENTGVYFAALKTIALLAFVRFAVGAATANRVASLHAAGEPEAFAGELQGAVNLTFWPTLIGAIVIVALSPFLLSLFGEEFANYAYLTAVLSVGFVVRSVVGPSELYLNVLGHQRACAAVLSGAALLNVVLNILLIPLFGLLGAALATTVSLIGLAASMFVIAKRRLAIAMRPTLPMTTIRKLLGGPKQCA